MGLGERQRRGGVDCSYHDRLMQVCWWVVHRKAILYRECLPTTGHASFLFGKQICWQA